MRAVLPRAVLRRAVLRRGAKTRRSASFGRVLVANRGEIALRIMRACAAEGLESVAVCAREDASSAHVAAATTSVVIGHESSSGGSEGGPIAPYLDAVSYTHLTLPTKA